MKSSLRSFSRSLSLLIVIGLAGLTAPLFGQLTYSIGDGDYNDSGTWNDSVPDDAGEYGLITGDNTVAFLPGDNFSVGSLGIGHSSANAGTGTFNMTGGTLTIDDGIGGGAFTIGESRGAQFNQSDGTLYVTGSVTLGYYYTLNSEPLTWNFTGGAAYVTGNVEIGRFDQAGNGVGNAGIDQANSILNVGGDVVLGSAVGGGHTDSYMLGSGAQLIVAGVIRGDAHGAKIFTFNGGTLSSTTSHDADDGFISGLTNVYVDNGGGAIDTSFGDLLISSDLEHTGGGPDGGLLKIGAGKLTLSGTSTYDGNTIIAEGTLIVDGSIGTSAVYVGIGTMLGGSGTVGALTLEAGSFLAPGNSPGTLNAGATVWNINTGYIWEINDAAGVQGTNWDHLNVTGTLTITATSDDPFNLYVLSLDSGNLAGLVDNFNQLQNYSYVIATASDGIFGFDPDAFVIHVDSFSNALAGAWSVSLGNSDHDLVLNYTAVPEPATYAMLAGLAALGLVAWRRRAAK